MLEPRAKRSSVPLIWRMLTAIWLCSARVGTWRADADSGLRSKVIARQENVHPTCGLA